MVLSCFTTNAQNPSLIPLPQSINWKNENFILDQCKSILISDHALSKSARDLQEILSVEGRNMKITTQTSGKKLPLIELKLGKVTAPSLDSEAYKINVSPNKILLTANMPHGIFNGLQTLRQLIHDGKIKSCEIKDWPAYQWRGYMVDVGRNFQSVKLLKQQIDIMSRYKLNVFHFHPTEDIAWRNSHKKISPAYRARKYDSQ